MKWLADWQYEESLSSSIISAVEKLSQDVRQLKEDISYSPPAQTHISAARSKHSSAPERGYRAYTPRVRKSNGEWRLTVDYRGLNEVTPPMSAAMPDMLELQCEPESKAAKWYAMIHRIIEWFGLKGTLKII
ncbi:hypothetical protein GRJ2_003292700 [Grus japonensis]|uniref:Uncharacterized protein n=1 Tax=Grus japonensis TaxID=30415 RepID=A0ABC9YDX8_GRUJA